jgi:hypothetical protein
VIRAWDAVRAPGLPAFALTTLLNGISLLSMTVSAPPSQLEMQAIASEVDDLINILRRCGWPSIAA